MNATNQPDPADHVFERQSKIRFDDLDELFFARVLLTLLEDPSTSGVHTVEFRLNHLFRPYSMQQLIDETSNTTFEDTSRLNEQLAEAFTAMTGRAHRAASRTLTLLEHYRHRVLQALSFLQKGDGTTLPPTITSFVERSSGVYHVTFDAERLRSSISETISPRLELPHSVADKMSAHSHTAGTYIHYAKELQFLLAHLMVRQEATGEATLSYTTREVRFRHAIKPLNGFAMPAVGCCGPSEKPLLTLYLEVSGILDIQSLLLGSLPSSPRDLEVKYVVRLPAVRNLFGASAQGLNPAARRTLSEVQLSVFARIHQQLQFAHAFAARPALERDFAELLAWILKKVAYCLEDPSFLTRPARAWLASHSSDSYKKIENDFFLPFLQERLHDHFGSRVKRKPEMHGGEVDLLVGDLPIELKVHRGHTISLQIDDRFRPAAQASAYAGHTRIGFVLVLDLPTGTPESTNFDSCFHVVERKSEAGFPTCIVVCTFPGHHTAPSSLR